MKKVKVHMLLAQHLSLLKKHKAICACMCIMYEPLCMHASVLYNKTEISAHKRSLHIAATEPTILFWAFCNLYNFVSFLLK